MSIQPVKQPPISKVEKWEKKQTRLELKAFFYYLAHLILKPISSERSKYFKVKLHRTEAKIDAIRKRALFPDNFVASGLNYPKSDVVKKKEDASVARELIAKLVNEKEKIENAIGCNINFKSEKSIETSEVKGICLGISIDVARRRLLEDENLVDIMASLEKGGSSDAAALQGITGTISTTTRKGGLLPSLYRKMEALQNAKDTPDALKFDVKKFENFMTWLLEKKDVDEFWEQDGEDRVDQQKIVRAATTCSACLGILVVPSFEIGNEAYPTLNGKRVGEDKELSDFFIYSLCVQAPAIYKMQVLSALNGLQVNSCEDKMGSYLFHDDDASYLGNLNELDDGVYLIGLSQNDGRHAISLVREGGVDYIIDPNGMQLKSNDKEETRALLLKLLEEYPPPPSEKEGASNHRLEIYKYTAAATS